MMEHIASVSLLVYINISGNDVYYFFIRVARLGHMKIYFDNETILVYPWK